MGPGSPVDSDFALGLTYSPVCVGLDRVEAGPGSRAVYEMWRAAAEGAGAVLPGGAPCSYGAGVRFEGVHWLGPVVAFRAAVEGAWSWDVEELPAPERVWRFSRYGVDLGVRFGRALGVVRPWVDVGAVIGSGSHFPARPAQVAATEPAFDARAIRRSTSCSTCRLGVPPALPARSARVWTSGGGTAFGLPFVGRGPCWARASGARTWSARASRGRSGRSSGSEAGGCRLPSSARSGRVVSCRRRRGVVLRPGSACQRALRNASIRADHRPEHVGVYVVAPSDEGQSVRACAEPPSRPLAPRSGGGAQRRALTAVSTREHCWPRRR